MFDIHNLHPLCHSPFDGGIDVVDDVTIVLGDVVLDVNNDKCFIAHHLLNYKTTGIEIAIESAVGGGKFEYAIVRVGYTAGVVLLVAVAPDHLLRSRVSQHLHCATQHHTFETFGIAEIDAGLGVSLVLSHTYGECVGGEIERLDPLAFAWLQHGLGPRKTFLVH